MAKVSSAPADARKEQQSESILVMLRPGQIKLTKGNALARPGPPPPDEQKAIAGLARDLRKAQSVPVIVGAPLPGGLYPLIAGKRRREAALLIESEDAAEFRLECIVRPPDRDYLFDSVRENLKRRNLTALQFAHLCREIREEKGWTGTKEVAAFLGVSRAQVSEHDKLLHRPAGMPKATYDELLALVQSGRAGAGTAFYTLTHVEPVKAPEVLAKAQELAEAEEASKAKKPAIHKPEPPATSPRSAKARESAFKTKAEPAKTTIPAAKVEKKHVQQAARESGAVRSSTQRTLPEMRVLFAKLTAPEWPDRLRNFASIVADAWWNGRATDAEVIAKWKELAACCSTGERVVHPATNKHGKKRTKHAA